MDSWASSQWLNDCMVAGGWLSFNFVARRLNDLLGVYYNLPYKWLLFYCRVLADWIRSSSKASPPATNVDIRRRRRSTAVNRPLNYIPNSKWHSFCTASITKPTSQSVCNIRNRYTHPHKKQVILYQIYPFQEWRTFSRFIDFQYPPSTHMLKKSAVFTEA